MMCDLFNLQLIKKFAYKQETEGDNSGDDEKESQEDEEVQREEQEILNKDGDDAENASDRMYFIKQCQRHLRILLQVTCSIKKNEHSLF